MKMYFKKIKYMAMTLAEVLIVITIVGVIASITIPQLIANYQKNQTIEQLKQTFSILNNALDSAKVDYGTDINNWSIQNDSYAVAATSFATTYLLPYVKTTDVCGLSTTAACTHRIGYASNIASPTKNYYFVGGSGNMYSFTLANGVMVAVSPAGITSTLLKDDRIQIYFDINGKSGPNITGKDGFVIELGGSGTDKNKFLPYGFSASTLRSTYMTGVGTVACNTTSSGAFCFALIMKDGWQIASDYPW